MKNNEILNRLRGGSSLLCFFMLIFSTAGLQAIEHSDEEQRNTKPEVKVRKDNAETNTTFAKIYVTNTYIKISKEAIITPVEIVYKAPKKERSPSHNKNEKKDLKY